MLGSLCLNVCSCGALLAGRVPGGKVHERNNHTLCKRTCAQCDKSLSREGLSSRCPPHLESRLCGKAWRHTRGNMLTTRKHS